MDFQFQKAQRMELVFNMQIGVNKMSDYRDLIYQDALKQEAWRKKVFPSPKIQKYSFSFLKWTFSLEIKENQK